MKRYRCDGSLPSSSTNILSASRFESICTCRSVRFFGSIVVIRSSLVQAKEVVAKTGTLETRDTFGPDVQLHIEFATPPPVGNSRSTRRSARLRARVDLSKSDS